MKKSVYICDACGKQIEGLPVKLDPCSYDQDGDITELSEDFAEAWSLNFQKKDFCIGCFEKIVKSIQPEEFDQSDEGADQNEGEEEMTDEEEAEICDRIENIPRKSGRYPQLDIGKIKALYNAGWNANKIADEMRCAKSAVYRHLSRLREAGEIE